MSAANQALATLGDDVDQRLRADTVEGESDAIELLDRYAELVIADEVLAELARARAQRLEKRAQAHRTIVERMLIALELTEPIERSAYTASLTYRTNAIITDATALPDEVVRRAPDMRLIAKLLHDGHPVDGATLSNPIPSLTIRTR